MVNYQVKVGSKSFTVEKAQRFGSQVQFSINGQDFQVEVSALVEAPSASTSQFTASIAVSQQTTAPSQSSKDTINAPMPGIISQILVKAGDSIDVGTTVAVIEAMKMENPVKATHAGKVAKVLVAAGTEVSSGQVLVKL